MSTLLILPVIAPLAAATLAIFAPRNLMVQRMAGIVGPGMVLLVGAALLWRVRDGTILTMAMGGWEAPFGIVFVADVLAAVMVFLTGAVGLGTAVYSLGHMTEERLRWHYFPLLNVLLMGVSGAFLTGDLFNLFVWFEVLLIASFVLLAMGGARMQLEGAIKYVVLNLFSSVLFLAALGILYGLVGTVNMADLAVKLADTDRPGLVTTVAMLFLVVFGIKAAAFPLFFWLPSSYHTPPSAVSALFAGLLTKVGVYAILRTFTLIFTQDVAFSHGLIVVMAVVTMVAGVLGAIAQSGVRRALSFLHISQVGYLLLGTALLTPLSLAAVLFYIVHHVFVISNLFFLAGIAHRLQGTLHLDRVGGLARRAPLFGILFLIPALSLAGVPPLSGFWAKYLLVRAGLEAQAYVAIGLALAAAFLGLYCIMRIWSQMFWKEAVAPAASRPAGRQRWGLLLGPAIAFAAVTLGIGLMPGPLFELAEQGAAQLLHPAQYIQAVLGGSP